MANEVLPDSLNGERQNLANPHTSISFLPISLGKAIERVKYSINNPKEGWRRTEEDLYTPMVDIVNDNVPKDHEDYQELLEFGEWYDMNVNKFPYSFIINNNHSNNIKGGKYDKIKYLKQLKDVYMRPLP